MDLDREPLGKGVHHGSAHAVEAAGNLIAAAAEFAAGVEHRVHHFQSGPAGLGLDVHGNTAAVVGDGDGVAGVDGDGDVLAVACQRFIDGVVHDLVDQMMQAGNGGGADIHTRALPDRFQPFQHLDLLRTVFLCYLGFFRHSLLLRFEYSGFSTLSPRRIFVLAPAGQWLPACRGSCHTFRCD